MREPGIFCSSFNQARCSIRLLAAAWGPDRAPDTEHTGERASTWTCFQPLFLQHTSLDLYPGLHCFPSLNPPLLFARSSEVPQPLRFFFFLFSHCLPQVNTVPELNQNVKVTNNYRVIFQYHHWLSAVL